jgi:hypothetical protein
VGGEGTVGSVRPRLCCDGSRAWRGEGNNRGEGAVRLTPLEGRSDVDGVGASQGGGKRGGLAHGPGSEMGLLPLGVGRGDIGEVVASKKGDRWRTCTG